MFRSKRNSLVKRLWRQRIIVQASRDEATCTLEKHEDFEVKSVAQSMLKRLKESQLELLVQAVESKGAESCGCVLVPKGDLRMGRRSASPHVLVCQLWRWPDLRHPYELKRLHWCESVDDPLYICCNPYHWSKLCKPESPPPPYSRFPQELFNPEDRAPSEYICPDTETSRPFRIYPSGVMSGGDSCSASSQQDPPWCTIAYWELQTRVGRLFPVQRPWLHIFSDLPHGEGLSLGALAQGLSCRPQEAVRRTREKIGLGVTVSREEDGVWVYNRSDHAIFVNSPTLDQPNVRTLTVYKVLPGYSIRIFDWEKARQYQRLYDPKLLDGPFDPNAVRISFAKGWGPKYSRQFITSCPCWLEILLTVPR